jgi:hypothetical protein
MKADLVFGDNTSGFPIDHIKQRLPLRIPVGNSVHDIAVEGDGQAMPMRMIVFGSAQRSEVNEGKRTI